MNKCSNNVCLNVAITLKWPTCVKLNMKDMFYCSQTCFSKYWLIHKSIHFDDLSKFNNFNYSSTLRKGIVYPINNIHSTY